MIDITNDPGYSRAIDPDYWDKLAQEPDPDDAMDTYNDAHGTPDP